MKNQKIGLTLFWIGLILAVTFAGVLGRPLYQNLRTLTMEQFNATIWSMDKPLWMFWMMSVPLGSVLAGIGAFVYVKNKPVFTWLTGVGVLAAVGVMNMVWGRVYNSTLFGIAGVIILITFFGIVWVWLKKYAALDVREKVAGSFKMVGYLFWINASWFLCGETGKVHLKVFEDASLPSPIEIIVFLVLGWIFVLIGDYKEMRVRAKA